MILYGKKSNCFSQNNRFFIKNLFPIPNLKIAVIQLFHSGALKLHFPKILSSQNHIQAITAGPAIRANRPFISRRSPDIQRKERFSDHIFHESGYPLLRFPGSDIFQLQ